MGIKFLHQRGALNETVVRGQVSGAVIPEAAQVWRSARGRGPANRGWLAAASSLGVRTAER